MTDLEKLRAAYAAARDARDAYVAARDALAAQEQEKNND
jgi:hypothetical protein